MPAFDAGEFVAAAIRSVIDQTMDDWELLVADDGSTDATVAIAAGFGDDRIRILRATHSGLPAVGRNRAFREARGELIALLDADDIWRPDKLRRELEILAQRPDVGVVHTRADIISGDVVEHSTAGSGAASIWPTFQDLLRSNRVLNSSAMLRRELFEQHGLFDEDPRLRGTEDYEFWLRVAPHTRFAFLDEPLLLYRDHPRGISKRVDEIELGVLLAQERNLNRYPEERRRADPGVLATIGALRCIYGLAGRGRPELLASARREPWRLRTWKWLVLSLFPGGWLSRLRRPNP
jgi:glycosyltransferase involved in cell wall biosynthesis